MRRAVLAAVFGLLLTNGQPALAQAYQGKIAGTFNGWQGETIYRLMDGHIIQQAQYHYHYHYAYSPAVIIYSSGGGYKIHVEDDTDEDIEVRFLR